MFPHLPFFFRHPDMFDLGFQEIIVIFIVALIVFGPKRLPELARTVGKWVGEIKRGVQAARYQIESEIDDIDRKPFGGTTARPDDFDREGIRKPEEKTEDREPAPEVKEEKE